MGRPKGSKNKVRDDEEEGIVANAGVDDGDDDVQVNADEDEEDDSEEFTPPVRHKKRWHRNEGGDVPTQGQLAKAIQALADQAPIRQVPYGKFKTRSPFNPTGRKDRVLTRRCYQNGYFIDIVKLTDKEIELLNAAKPGKYINGSVAFVELQNGGNLDFHIHYKNATIDQRMANSSEWRSFGELLQRCVDEAAARV